MESIVVFPGNISKIAKYFKAKGISFSEYEIKKQPKECFEKLIEAADDENMKEALRKSTSTSRNNLLLKALMCKDVVKEEPNAKQPKKAHSKESQESSPEKTSQETSQESSPKKAQKEVPKASSIPIVEDEVPKESPNDEHDNIPDEKPKKAKKNSTRKSKQPSEEVPQQQPVTLAPIQQSKGSTKLARPSLQVPSFEYEKEHAFDYIQALIDTYDFDSGKKQMKTGRMKSSEKPLERTEAMIAEEKEVAAGIVGELKEYYEALVSSISDFAKEHNGKLKITDDDTNGFKIIIQETVTEPIEETSEEATEGATEKSGKKSSKKVKKTTKDVKFDGDYLVNAYTEALSKVFKFISKDFIARHYKSVLMSGILNSRSIIQSTYFKLSYDSIDRVGILKSININIIGNDIQVKLPKDNFVNDYYWLLINSKRLSNIDAIAKAEKAAKTDKNVDLSNRTCGNAYEVFSKRKGIINHIGYPHIKIVEAWNKALENMSSPETDIERIWLEVLKSPFMFDIIMYGTPMNKFVEAAFKVLVNQYESCKLYFTKLFPISFMFTSLHMFVDGDKIETCLSNWQGLYKYESFTWCAKELSDVRCVIDLFNEMKLLEKLNEKTEKKVEEKPEENIEEKAEENAEENAEEPPLEEPPAEQPEE